MTKLLCTDIQQLFKNKVFRIVILVLPLFSAVMMSISYFYAKNTGYEPMIFDNFYFQLAPNLSTFFAIVTSFFIGTQYNDGTLRNKVVIGHTRTSIYISNLLTSILASFLLVAVWLIGGLAGIPLLGTLQMNALTFIKYLIVCLFFSCSLTAIFTLIGMLSQNKATTAVISIAFSIVLTIYTNMVCGNFQQPEYIDTVLTNVHGIRVPVTCINPKYIGGIKRIIAEIVLNILPTGQASLMSAMTITRPALQIISSSILTILISTIGIYIFKKKDLK